MSPEIIEQLLDARAMSALAPLMALAFGVVALLLVDILPLPRALRGAVVLATLGLAAGFQMSIFKNPPGAVLEGSLQADATTAVWGLIFVASTLIAWLFAQRYYVTEKALLAEHDVLMLTSCCGMMMMAGARDLLVFFIGLELLSIPLYALAGFRRTNNASVEAGLKYFILGAFGAAIFLYGAALLYSDTGTIRLEDLRLTGAGTPLAVAGAALIAASLLFKVGVVPFHLWVPDVYQGSPTPVTALMVTGTKAAGFAFLLNASFLLPEGAAMTLAVLAILTLAIGNLGALMQTDLKRMLAYSGIAHAGTLLFAVTGALAGDPEPGGAMQAALFYSAAYVFTAGGAFGLIAAIEARTGRAVNLASIRGLAQRSPGAAAAMALFMLSLGGIPATGGFLGKYLVFSVLVRADMIAVAVLGIVLSVVALGYYLRVVVAMYMQEESESEPAAQAPQVPATWIAGACAAMVVVLGVLPGWFLDRL